MDIVRKQKPGQREKDAILKLWNNEYPEQIRTTATTLDAYFEELKPLAHYFLTDGKAIYGWLFVFMRDGQRWFAMILDRSMHRKGYGSQMLGRAKKDADILYGWVTDHDRYVRKDGTAYPSPLHFYYKNGFKLITGERLEIDMLSAAKIRWTRTEGKPGN